jgi:DNA-binding MarR family transcriptional regulator
MAALNENEIDRMFQTMSLRADELYKFVLLYGDYISMKRDYGTGYEIGMIEAHTLTYIEEHPGVTVNDLTKVWNKTKGTVSLMVTRLEEAGFVTKQRENGNQRTVHLYVTESGERLSLAHKKFDISDIAETTASLLKELTPAELDTFYKVIRIYTNLLLE